MTRHPSLPAAAAAACLLLQAAAPAAAGGGESPPVDTFRDRLDVHRIVVDVRVLDHRGQPVTGLAAEDFRVRIGREAVTVESAEWSGRPVRGDEPPAGPFDRQPAPREPTLVADPGAGGAGRLVVLFFQTADFYMQSKASGHLRMLPRVQTLIDELAPGDRVAILRYGAHLDLTLDFTADHPRVRRAVHQVVLGRPEPGGERVDDDPWAAPEGGPADDDAPVRLAAHLGRAAALDAATPEKALRLVAEALAEIPGAKTIVWVGWGLGTRHFGRVQMERDYDPAMQALEAGRTSVFVLDVSEADYHTLEDGLRQVAWASGGTYSGTWHFPDTAVRLLRQALSESYTLVLAAPPLGPGEHRLRVDLVGAKGRVLAPATLYGEPADG